MLNYSGQILLLRFVSGQPSRSLSGCLRMLVPIAAATAVAVAALYFRIPFIVKEVVSAFQLIYSQSKASILYGENGLMSGWQIMRSPITSPAAPPGEAQRPRVAGGQWINIGLWSKAGDEPYNVAAEALATRMVADVPFVGSALPASTNGVASQEPAASAPPRRFRVLDAGCGLGDSCLLWCKLFGTCDKVTLCCPCAVDAIALTHRPKARGPGSSGRPRARSTLTLLPDGHNNDVAWRWGAAPWFSGWCAGKAQAAENRQFKRQFVAQVDKRLRTQW